MKRGILLMMVSVFAAAGLWAQSGKSCTSAIPIGKDFSAEIKQAPQTIWYSAWTFDLPMTIAFIPENGKDDPAPLVEMDFTCRPGIYNDSILCSLFCKNGSSGLELDMPHKPAPSTGEIEKDGVKYFVYYFSAGKKYRDLLLQMGISYNLEVFVKVTFQCKGIISMVPDNTFANCMDNAKFMQYGDIFHVKAHDKETHVIVPYVQWQEDSIRYIWEGEKESYVAIAGVCDFDPTAFGEEILDIRYMDAGRDTAKVTSELMRYYVRKADNQAGMFYAKCYAESDGILKVERVPMAPPRGDATVLKYGKQVLLNTHDTSLFAMPVSWKKDSIKFTTPTHHLFRVFIDREPSFSTDAADMTRQFSPSLSGHWCGLYAEELKPLWEQTTDKYLYVRFDCSEATTVTPYRWDVSECAAKSYLLTLDTVLTINGKSSTIFRFYYPSIAGGELSFQFDQSQNCDLLFSDSCEIASYAEGPGVKYATKTVRKNLLTISAEEVAEHLAPLADEDGYIYARFYLANGSGGKMTIKSTAPKDADPVYPSMTIAVVCEGDKVQVISRIEQQIAIEDVFGKPQDYWNAQAGEPHVLNLPSGTYVVVCITSGEKIVLML